MLVRDRQEVPFFHSEVRVGMGNDRLQPFDNIFETRLRRAGIARDIGELYVCVKWDSPFHQWAIGHSGQLDAQQGLFTLCKPVAGQVCLLRWFKSSSGNM
jgi:hypothetical protein